MLVQSDNNVTVSYSEIHSLGIMIISTNQGIQIIQSVFERLFKIRNFEKYSCYHRLLSGVGDQ